MSDYTTEFPLLKWFERVCKKQRNSQFPGSGNTNYWALFSSIHDYLNNHVHPNVEAGAAASEKSEEHGLYLTKHGPDHIKVVIMRAQTLIATKAWAENQSGTYQTALQPFEVFVLLMAIHFHDIANRTGRQGHERKIRQEVDKIEAVKQIDTFLLKEIVKIASCHGGKLNGNLDKIGTLLVPIAHLSPVRYRPQLIAAILKLADELADDRTRADLHGLRDLGTFPSNSVLFHKYAAALTTVWLDAASGAVDLVFKFSKKDACSQFQKPEGETFVGVYLLDYIYERTLKTYRELVYCNRFMRQLPVNYHEVKVSIEVYSDDQSDTEADANFPLEKIEYVIGNTGYPDDRHGTLEVLAKNFDATLTGTALAGKLHCGVGV